MSQTIERLARQIQKEISLIIIRAKDTTLQKVNVIDVNVTNDLSYATVFYSGHKEQREAMEAVLSKSKGYIKAELASRIKARKIPDLIFKYDQALDYGNHIEKLLNDIKK